MKVLIALDESAASLRAARVAVGLFPSADAEFLVINVSRVSPPWGYPIGGFGAVGLIPGYELLEPPDLVESELAERAEKAGVENPQLLTDLGDPADCICAAAEEHDVAVVVVGSHDKGVLARLLDPSVAAGVIRGTHRPVLVVSGEAPGPSGTH